MSFKNLKVPKVPGGLSSSALVTVSLLGGLGLYAAMNILYNVEGGHRAIVFNLLVGIKEKAVSREIRKILTGRAANFNIALDVVSITSLTSGKGFTAAIEAKQVAAQEAERARYVVEKAEQDKRSAIIRAQGEAKSAQLMGEALANNPAFITLRKIEAAREIAQTIANSANRVFLSSDDLLLNLQELNLESSAAPRK